MFPPGAPPSVGGPPSPLLPASVLPPVAPEAPLASPFVPEALAPVPDPVADPEVPERFPAAPDPEVDPVAPEVPPVVAAPLVVAPVVPTAPDAAGAPLELQAALPPKSSTRPAATTMGLRKVGSFLKAIAVPEGGRAVLPARFAALRLLLLAGTYCTLRMCLHTGHHPFMGLSLQKTVWPPGVVPPLPPTISKR